MVKRKPLRLGSHTSSAPTPSSNPSKGLHKAGKEGEQRPMKKPKNDSLQKSNSSEVDNEEDEWAEIERQQEKGKKSIQQGEDESDDDDEDDDDDDSDEDDIKLHGESGNKTDDFTFEFNDMRESYSEGICTLLSRNLISNPTSAYTLASSITAQGMFRAISSRFLWHIHLSLYIYIYMKSMTRR